MNEIYQLILRESIKENSTTLSVTKIWMYIKVLGNKSSDIFHLLCHAAVLIIIDLDFTMHN